MPRPVKLVGLYIDGDAELEEAFDLAKKAGFEPLADRYFFQRTDHLILCSNGAIVLGHPTEVPCYSRLQWGDALTIAILGLI